MRLLPKSIERAINALSRLPGIGPKTASRLAFYLFKLPDHELETFWQSLKQLKSDVTVCSVCFNMAEAKICAVCSDKKRKPELICVVEEPLDVSAIESAGSFSGLYHVLGGIISPIDGIGPEQLKIKELELRITALINEKKQVEVILATNPSLEGDTTALYISRLLKPLGVKLTRLARGIPVGGDLEYTDELTMADAINYRKEI